MEITRHLSYRVNLGNYEHVDFGASITVRDTDVTIDPECSPARVVEILDRFATEQLDSMLTPDLSAAGQASTSKDTFAKVEAAPEPAPPTTRRPRKRN